MTRPVRIVSVIFDCLFYLRLLVEKSREFLGSRDYEIAVVDRGSRAGNRERQGRRNRHSRGEAAEFGVRAARNEMIAFLDSDAHPVEPQWLDRSADRLAERCRLNGAQFHTLRRDKPQGWYILPHLVAVFRADPGTLLRESKGLSY